MEDLKMVVNHVQIVAGIAFLLMAIYYGLRGESAKSQSALLWAILCFLLAK